MTRALVTGGAGFIGSHLVRELARRGDEIVALDNLRRGSRERIGYELDCGAADLVERDIRDLDALRRVARGCDVIYHLAAQSNSMGALDDPEYSFTTNAWGTFNVLRCAVELGVRRVVFTSSREVYGEAQYTPVDEDHALAAKNPYGASKVAGEAYCRTFANCHGIDVAILRLANVYGPDDSDRVIPLWLSESFAGRDLRVYGGRQILDFVWIDTVVQALVVAGEEGLAGPTNVGSGSGTTILELARRILEITRSSSALTRVPARGPEVQRFIADISRLRALGIEPDADPLLHLQELADAYAGVAA
jgi:UDP-glucose 4-epimerase